MKECTNKSHDEDRNVPVVRSYKGGQNCFKCDLSLISNDDIHADQIRSYWAHPAVMSKMMDDYPGYETKSELGVVQGEGQDPRKPGDPRPNLKVVGWKKITWDG